MITNKISKKLIDHIYEKLDDIDDSYTSYTINIDLRIIEKDPKAKLKVIVLVKNNFL